jgi:hypothetical protein
MKITELLIEGPTVADVIRAAAQPASQSTTTPPPSGNKPSTTAVGTQPPGSKPTTPPANTSTTPTKQPASTTGSPSQPVDLTKIPPAQIQQKLRPGQTVDMGNLGKVKIGQVTSQGVELDGTDTPVGSKFTIPFKTLNQP